MTAAESLPVKREKYELVPPDGGYGYVILFAVTMILTAVVSLTNSFGLIYNDFFEVLKMGSTSITLLTGTTAMCSSASGFLTGPLMKRMSMRKLALLGSAFYNAGAIGTVFVKSQALFIFCLGVLQSFGMGILINLSWTAVNAYFVQNRLFATSLVQTITAVAAVIWPMVIGRASEHYGFRGKLVLVAAVGAQAFVGTALLQPVAWHMKKVIKDNSEDEIPENHLLLEKSYDDKQMEPMLTPVIKLSDIENVDVVFPPGNNINEKSAKDNTVIELIKDFVDWQLFKRFVFTCSCLGAPLVLFADITFVLFLAPALYASKWTENGVALAFSLLGLGDIVARIFLIFFSSWLKKFETHPVYVIGICAAIIIKLAMAWVTDYVASLVIITVLGATRCVISVLYPLVIADAVKPEEFSSAMGMSLMMYGLLSLVLGLISGAIRDVTGNYTTMFLILIGFKVAVVIAWIAELVINKKRQSNTTDNVQKTVKKEIN